ncbi:hypothetical protein GCM10022254_06780 [Actinomadura meridiana]|uniref:Large ribosomal subunit protein bL12 C-terminal domain-containing protein n=1 Tax=Actinomadura meridiana TaxID=559626 RepID=A0ABP8BT69_9ACTN
MKSPAPPMSPEAYEMIIVLIGKGQDIQAIKTVREITGLGLKKAKDLVDGMKGEAFARAVPIDVQAKARALIAEGRPKDAVRLVREDIGLGSRAAKDFVDALMMGRVPTMPLPDRAPGTPMGPAPGHAGLAPASAVPTGATLSDRVRAFKYAGDHESAVALVCAETGMNRDEAHRFVDAVR